MNDVDLGPKSGALLFNSLKDKNSIILAARSMRVLLLLLLIPLTGSISRVAI